MKKLIALSSFLFLFLMAALPGQVSLAAGNDTNAVKVTGISLVTDKGELKAVGNGNHYSFDLTGIPANTQVKALKVTSDSAVTLSLFSKSNPGYKDAYDILFVNGTVTIDKNRVENWTKKFGDEIYYQLFPSGKNTDFLFTIQDLRNEIKKDGLFTGNVGYVSDAKGNESQVTVAFKTAGWAAKGGKWYYYNDQAVNAKGWVKDYGVWYYLNPNGAMATGWVKDHGVWYYLNPKGAMAAGWVKDHGVWYYLKANGAMATGWVKDHGAWYYLNPNGAMATGWVKDHGVWYFLKANGAMTTGWVKSGSHWYYMDGSGAMKTGLVAIGKHRYRFNVSGVWIG